MLLYKLNESQKKVIINKKITREMLSMLSELFTEESSLIIESSTKRLYPYKSLASHLLGYLGTIDDTN